MRSSTLLGLAASLSSATAVYQGFNYGAAKSDGSFQTQSDFQALFSTAKNLVGTSGFSSARLYTMIQGGSSTNEPISAIPAAIAEDTTLLLGIWASGGDGGVQAEIIALKSAIEQYGTAFTKLVAGISVGSEDLYRNSPTGIAANSGYGADPDAIVNYINQVRSAIKGTPLSDAPIGHVDTWTAWVNSSNSAVAEASDWIGIDAYPYFQNSQANSVGSGADLFNDAFSATQAAVGDKPIWITETGWPVTGKTENLATPSKENAQSYWKSVGCPNFGKVNTWWYTLQDAAPVTPNPSFGIVGSTLSTKPLFDLSCSGAESSSSSTPVPTSSSSSKPEPTSPGGESGPGGATPSNEPGSGGSGSTSDSGSDASATGTTSSLESPSSPSLPSQGGSTSLTNTSSTGSPTGGSGGNGSSCTSSGIGATGTGSPTGGSGGNGSSSSCTSSGIGATGTGTGGQSIGQPTGTGIPSSPSSPPSPTDNPSSASVVSGSLAGVMAAVLAVAAIL